MPSYHTRAPSPTFVCSYRAKRKKGQRVTLRAGDVPVLGFHDTGTIWPVTLHLFFGSGRGARSFSAPFSPAAPFARTIAFPSGASSELQLVVVTPSQFLATPVVSTLHRSTPQRRSPPPGPPPPLLFSPFAFPHSPSTKTLFSPPPRSSPKRSPRHSDLAVARLRPLATHLFT